MDATLVVEEQGLSQSRQCTAPRHPREPDPALIGACIQAATAIVIARHLHTGGELEKQISERAYKIYEAAIGRFGLSGAPVKL